MNTTVLTEEQRSLLTLSIEIARDKFASNASKLTDQAADVFATPPQLEAFQRLADQFAEQSEQASTLLLLVSNADYLTVVQEVNAQEEYT